MTRASFTLTGWVEVTLPARPHDARPLAMRETVVMQVVAMESVAKRADALRRWFSIGLSPIFRHVACPGLPGLSRPPSDRHGPGLRRRIQTYFVDLNTGMGATGCAREICGRER